MISSKFDKYGRRRLLDFLLRALPVFSVLVLWVPCFRLPPSDPLLLRTEAEYAMFEHFKNFQWVLSTIQYEDSNDLLANIENVIAPAEERRKLSS